MEVFIELTLGCIHPLLYPPMNPIQTEAFCPPCVSYFYLSFLFLGNGPVHTTNVLKHTSHKGIHSHTTQAYLNFIHHLLWIHVIFLVRAFFPLPFSWFIHKLFSSLPFLLQSFLLCHYSGLTPFDGFSSPFLFALEHWLQRYSEIR